MIYQQKTRINMICLFISDDNHNTMKNKKYHTCGTIPKSIIKIDTPNTQIHGHSLS